MLADALSAARSDRTDNLRAKYERAVLDCDAAWDGVEGAMLSGLYALAAEAHTEFRHAYCRKVSLYHEILEAA